MRATNCMNPAKVALKAVTAWGTLPLGSAAIVYGISTMPEAARDQRFDS